jgi:hypothetical protein
MKEVEYSWKLAPLSAKSGTSSEFLPCMLGPFFYPFIFQIWNAIMYFMNVCVLFIRLSTCPRNWYFSEFRVLKKTICIIFHSSVIDCYHHICKCWIISGFQTSYRGLEEKYLMEVYYGIRNSTKEAELVQILAHHPDSSFNGFLPNCVEIIFHLWTFHYGVERCISWIFVSLEAPCHVQGNVIFSEFRVLKKTISICSITVSLKFLTMCQKM